MTAKSRPLAAVTGASSGIGKALARQLVERGHDVVLAAEDPGLDAVTHELAADGASVTPVHVDLATAEGVERLFAAIESQPRALDVLVLNAGVGVGGAFVETPWEADRNLIALNVVSTVHLAKLVLPGMVARADGRVLLTASVQSTMPGPYYATYAASKAFVLSFAESIRYELRDAGVTVTALMPGPTDTDFFRRAGMEQTRAGRGPKDDPDEVARDALDAMMAGDDHVVAGSVKNKAQVVAGKVMPDTAKAAAAARLTRPGSGS